MLRKRKKWIVICALGTAAATGVVLGAWLLAVREPPLRVDEILATFEQGNPRGLLTIRLPFDGTLFPPEIPPPTFQWEDRNAAADAWLVTIQPPRGCGRMSFEARATEWTPSAEDWELIKRLSRDGPTKVSILGVRRARQDTILSAASLAFRVSPHEVGAPIFYREVNLPFIEAVKDPSRIRWRCGSVSARQPPPVVLEKLPVCGNCHSFSATGHVMGMDVDYANEKGSPAILPVDRDMELDVSKIITWDDYRREDRQPTFGLLSQVSPNGRYVVSTVKDRSVFVPREDLAYSQLFFPIKGILVFYDRQTKQSQPVPGADDPQ